MPINKTELITAIKSGIKYETITQQLNVSKRTIIRYANECGESRKGSNGKLQYKNGKPQYNNGERKFKGERIVSHYCFSQQTAKDSFVEEMF